MTTEEKLSLAIQERDAYRKAFDEVELQLARCCNAMAEVKAARNKITEIIQAIVVGQDQFKF